MSTYNNVIYQLSVSADVIQQLRKKCYDMHREDIILHKDIHDIYNSLEPCPCTWWQGWRDRRFIFQWQAWYDGSLCHQQRFPRNEAAQFCCYSLKYIIIDNNRILFSCNFYIIAGRDGAH